MNTDIKKDSSSHYYLESLLNNNEAIRITLIKNGWDGKCFRIQIKELNNHLRPGPEIPEKNLEEVIFALLKLKMELH